MLGDPDTNSVPEPTQPEQTDASGQKVIAPSQTFAQEMQTQKANEPVSIPPSPVPIPTQIPTYDASSSQPDIPKTSKRKIKTVLFGMILLMLLAVAFFAGSYKQSQVHSIQQLGKDYSDIRLQRRDAIKSLDDTANRQKRFLQGSGIVDTNQEPKVQKNDVCYISSTASGIITSSYQQRCWLKYASVYKTKYDTATVSNQLQTVVNYIKENGEVDSAAELFGQPYDNSYDKGSCIVRSSENDNQISGFKRTILAYRQANTGGDEQSSVFEYCRIPKPVERLDYLKLEKPSIKSIAAFDTSTLSNQDNLLIVVTDWEYFEEVLGCAAGSFMFCENPRTAPVHPELD